MKILVPLLMLPAPIATADTNIFTCRIEYISTDG